MFQVLSRLICLASLLVFPLLATAEAPKKYALLVGVTRYSHAAMNEPTPLEFPEIDAKSVGEVLRQNGYEVDLLLGEEATQSKIRDKLDGLGVKGNQPGAVVVGLWGHGVEIEGTNEAMFCPFDATLKQVRFADGSLARDKDTGKALIEPDSKSLISMTEVLGGIASSGAGNRVLLADCCRNSPHVPRGRAFGMSIKLSDLPGNTAALFACSTGEKAFEYTQWGHGAFTKSFLEILPQMAANENDVPAITGKLKNLVAETVSYVTKGRQTQTVHSIINGNPDLLLLRKTRSIPALLSLPFKEGTAKTAQDQWAEYLNKPVDHTNGIGMKFRLIPPGTFTMGSNESSPSQDERPHRVRISKPFYVASCETTVGQFSRFVKATGYKTTLETYDNGSNRGWNDNQGQFVQMRGFSWQNPGWSQSDDAPVVNVTWDDAQHFIEWLSGEEKRSYRFLTEAEWEYCCRAGSTSLYATGDDPRQLTKYGNVLDQTGVRVFGNTPEYRQNFQDQIDSNDGSVFTATVGSYAPNAFGLFDFHGNVCEWCSDWYGENTSDYGEFDPQGAPRGQERCARGGRFDTGKRLAMSFSRNKGPQGMSDMILGFRIALEVQ